MAQQWELTQPRCTDRRGQSGSRSQYKYKFILFPEQRCHKAVRTAAPQYMVIRALTSLLPSLTHPGSQTQPKHPTWPPLLPTPGTGARSSILILPFFFLQLPPGWILLTTPSGQTSLLLLPTLLPSCPWDNRGVQLGLTGWPVVPLTCSLTQRAQSHPNTTTLPSCHSPGRDRGQEGQPPTLLPADTGALHAEYPWL